MRAARIVSSVVIGAEYQSPVLDRRVFISPVRLTLPAHKGQPALDLVPID